MPRLLKAMGAAKRPWHLQCLFFIQPPASPSVFRVPKFMWTPMQETTDTCGMTGGCYRMFRYLMVTYGIFTFHDNDFP